jgi:hypothetical protein
VHVEDPADAGHEVDAPDARLELLEDPRGQTDRVRARASGDAVLDADHRAVGHDATLSGGRRLRREDARTAQNLDSRSAICRHTLL